MSAAGYKATKVLVMEGMNCWSKEELYFHCGVVAEGQRIRGDWTGREDLMIWSC